MDKLAAVLVLVVVAAGVATVLIYLRIDRERFVARTLLLQMRPGMLRWAEKAESALAQSGRSEARTHLEAMRSGPDRRPEELVPHANALHALMKKALAKNRKDPVLTAAGHELTDIYLASMNKQKDYNQHAARLQRLAKGRVTGAVWRLIRAKPVEKLDDLSVL